jgi:hypothetical protein
MNRRIMARFVDPLRFLPDNPAHLILDLISQIFYIDLILYNPCPGAVLMGGGREGVKPSPV